MEFSANDITQLSNLLATSESQPQKGVFSTESVLNPGTLGTSSSSKPKVQPNHPVKAIINRNKPPKKKFESEGRPEPEHEVG
jgi:hypothetical protein